MMSYNFNGKNEISSFNFFVKSANNLHWMMLMAISAAARWHQQHPASHVVYAALA